MKRSSSRKTNLKKRKAPVEEPAIIIPVQEPIINPAPQAKLDSLREKEIELEKILKIQQKSDELAKGTSDLAEGIKILSDGAKNVADTLIKWETVFGIMGATNNGETKTNDKWVRFVKPSDNDTLEISPKKSRNI